MGQLTDIVRRRITVGWLTAVAVVLLAGGSLAAVGLGGERTSRTQQETQQQDEVHGGPIERYHGEDCDLVDTSSFEGNWTHGDYVSAVAAADPTKVSEGARSRCGKPAHAGGPGGPPGHAKEAKEKAKTRGGKPDSVGTDAQPTDQVPSFVEPSGSEPTEEPEPAEETSESPAQDDDGPGQGPLTELTTPEA